MARRNNTEQASVEENTSATESTEAESTEAESTEAESTEAEIDLSDFQAAASAAVEARDEATGEIPLAQLEPVNVEYRKLDGIKPKNAAKSWLEDEVKNAITSLNVQLARAYTMVRDSLKAGATARTATERKPVDPKAAFVQKLASVKLAEYVLGFNLPEGVDAEAATNEAQELSDSLAEQVTQYREWLDAEVPEGEEKPAAPVVSPVVRAAFKVASGKASGGGGRMGSGSGVRRDISKHIQSAFEGLEDGARLSISQIANHTSAEYGDDHPSQGAVSARIFPASGGETTVPGIRQAFAEGDMPRGAIKDSSKA